MARAGGGGGAGRGASGARENERGNREERARLRLPSRSLSPLSRSLPPHSKWPGEFKYEAAAAKGHLPLTNALRGTQLFEAILEHPAFAEGGAGGAGGGGGGGAEGGKAGGGPAWL